tara:strand:- start:430 stop:858 length:429 start_codon:yes stop_codon:yes gene_type:complete
MLWKNFYQKYYELEPPIFGLNFLDDSKSLNKDFMLLCGFEKFNNIFVRIDILERLFIMIFNSNKDNQNKNRDIKLIPEMLNLLGCSRESFIKLLKYMDYKIFEKNNDIFFKYAPLRKNYKKNKNEINLNDNPFNKLARLNLK